MSDIRSTFIDRSRRINIKLTLKGSARRDPMGLKAVYQNDGTCISLYSEHEKEY